MSRAYRNIPGERDLSPFRVIEQRPSSEPGVHGGVCLCGTHTLHHLLGPGWICQPCYEKHLAAAFGQKVQP